MKATMQTLDQRIARATHAAATREQFANKDFRNAIKKAATRVRVSGIGVTVAFAQGKKEQHLDVAKAWCRALSELKETGIGDCATPEKLLEDYRKADFPKVRRLTELSKRILEWLAKWADAYKPQDERD